MCFNGSGERDQLVHELYKCSLDDDKNCIRLLPDTTSMTNMLDVLSVGRLLSIPLNEVIKHFKSSTFYQP